MSLVQRSLCSARRLFTRRCCHTKIHEKEYESVVGLEVHAQINSVSKLFSNTPVLFGSPTNTNVSYFDASLPGTLPVLNKYCVEAGILTALACNCTINKTSCFDRKHYFYPDLPAGYQITQQFRPLAEGGKICFVVHDGERGAYQCQSSLKQLQLEQDSGKSFHVKGVKSFVDLNRAGIGLMELVFEPDLKNGTEAAALVKELVNILKRIGTCTCEMEEGALRVDANISVNEVGGPLGVRTEVKNINSMRYTAKAIDFEIQRQIEILSSGGVVINETRSFDFQKKITVFMRDKEMLQDYRFMPEPNLPPIQLCDDTDVDAALPNVDDVRERLPTMPHDERCTLVTKYQLTLSEADKLVDVEGFKELFETAASQIEDKATIVDFLMYTLLAQLNSRRLSLKQSGLSGQQITDILKLLVSESVSLATATDILQMLLNGDNRTPEEIVKTYNWYLISDEKELEKLCSEVIDTYKKAAQKYRKARRQRHMTVLLVALNEKMNNRISIKDAEAVFIRLLLNKNK